MPAASPAPSIRRGAEARLGHRRGAPGRAGGARAEGLDRFVDPFDIERYNHHATIGENLLFGQPIGDTFQEDHLAAHPFVRAILEAKELTKPSTAMGVSIATSMIEIFAEIPDGSPLFERFSFFSAADRPYFQDLVERRNEQRAAAPNPPGTGSA